MAVQTVFQRYEMKYLLTQAQREAVLRALEPHMALDPYGRTVIHNLYLDTESYRLIRRSIEKPVYKEKGASAATARRIRTAPSLWS